MLLSLFGVVLHTSLECLQKWKIHEPFVIIDLLPGKEVNDLTYAGKLISYLLQYFVNITIVNTNLGHNILFGCARNCTATIFSKCVFQKSKFVLPQKTVQGRYNLYPEIYFLKILFIYFQRGGKERLGQKQQCVVASRMLPTGDLAGNPGMCPGWESNW